MTTAKKAEKKIGRLIEKSELNKPEPTKGPEVAPNAASTVLPTVGRIVLFHGTSGEVIGPAIVSRLQAVPGVVDLHVFEPDGGVHLRTGLQNTNLGGWTWPERVGV
jgi:hypothetical protein